MYKGPVWGKACDGGITYPLDLSSVYKITSSLIVPMESFIIK